MTVPGGAWLDGDEARAVRPYTVGDGRTLASHPLDLLSMVAATGRPARASLEPDHLHILRLCQRATSVAEIAAGLRLPAIVTKVLIGDLLDCGAVTARLAQPAPAGPDLALLERVRDGLRQLL